MTLCRTPIFRTTSRASLTRALAPYVSSAPMISTDVSEKSSVSCRSNKSPDNA